MIKEVLGRCEECSKQVTTYAQYNTETEKFHMYGSRGNWKYLCNNCFETSPNIIRPESNQPERLSEKTSKEDAIV